MFNLELAWDRTARTGPQPTSHTLRIRLKPQNRSGLGSGVPVMMAIALDTSGSMAGDKLARSKRACEAVVSLLRDQDRLWLAGFGTDLTRVADGLPGGSDSSKSVLARIDKLVALGVTRTDIALQWIESCLPETTGSARVGILITDGNPTDPMGKHNIDTTPLIQMAGRLAQAGVTVCAVGLGNANTYNSALLTQISDRGRGAFLYAETPEALHELLSRRLSTSQTVAATNIALEFERLMPGAVIRSACRFRPEYVPLEPVDTDGGCHLEIGSIQGDVDTDILVNVDVGAPSGDAWIGSNGVFSVRLTGHELPGAPAPEIASLTNTQSYTEAQRRDIDVEGDRLNWDVNTYSDALVKVQEQKSLGTVKMRKTGQLLSSMEQSARRAGNEALADDVAAQVTDLRRTGKLDAHRATGLLTASRSLGSSHATGVLSETPSVEDPE